MSFQWTICQIAGLKELELGVAVVSVPTTNQSKKYTFNIMEQTVH